MDDVMGTDGYPAATARQSNLHRSLASTPLVPHEFSYPPIPRLDFLTANRASCSSCILELA